MIWTNFFVLGKTVQFSHFYLGLRDEDIKDIIGFTHYPFCTSTIYIDKFNNQTLRDHNIQFYC